MTDPTVVGDPDALSLSERIATIAGRLPVVGKDERAPANMGGYAYRSIEAVVAALRPLLAEYGVSIVPQARLIEIRPAPGQKEAWQDVVLQVDYTIRYQAEEMVASVIGVGRDHTDKGASKALTAAFKAMLTQVFMIGGESDTEAADYSHGEQAPAPEPASEAQRQMLRDALSRAEDLDAAKEAWKAADLPAIDRMTARRIPDAARLLHRVDLITEAEAHFLDPEGFPLTDPDEEPF